MIRSSVIGDGQTNSFPVKPTIHLYMLIFQSVASFKRRILGKFHQSAFTIKATSSPNQTFNFSWNLSQLHCGCSCFLTSLLQTWWISQEPQIKRILTLEVSDEISSVLQNDFHPEVQVRHHFVVLRNRHLRFLFSEFSIKTKFLLKIAELFQEITTK